MEKNEIIKKHNLINYLNVLISNYEEKLNFQLETAIEDQKRFKMTTIVFTIALALGTTLDALLANTFLMIPTLIITTPFVATSVIGLPLSLIMRVSNKLETRKMLTEYRSIIDSAQKRKQYETRLLDTNASKKKIVSANEMLTEFISLDKKPTIGKSQENIPELDRLLIEKDKNNKKLQFPKEKKQKEIPVVDPETSKQGLSYDEKWLTNKELETYAYAIKPLLEAKKEGRLSEFLRDNYNVTDKEKIAMYDALLEEELSPSIPLLEETSSLEMPKQISVKSYLK